MKNKVVILSVIVILIGATGIFYSLKPMDKTADVLIEKEEAINLEEASTPEPIREDEVAIIYAHICGEVVAPGVYELQDQSRVIDLIRAAGGLTNKAASNYVNQAEKVMDGQKVYIPSMKETETATGLFDPETGMVDEGNTKVNINSADLNILMTLPGIGESKAKSILQYREEKGVFKSIEEIKNIEGIKDGVFSKIKDLIRVS